MRTLLTLLASITLLGCQPLVMLPGGQLRGEVTPAPADWSFSESIETVQLETRPDDPYSVNVWGIGMGSRFYVAAGRPDNRWAKHIEADPRVRLKLGDRIYELEAYRTKDPAELDAFVEAAKQKYDFEPDPEQRAQAMLFRLEPR